MCTPILSTALCVCVCEGGGEGGGGGGVEYRTKFSERGGGLDTILIFTEGRWERRGGVAIFT